MINTVIIDDDEHFRIIFAKILKTYFPEVNLLGTAHNVISGANLIKQYKPELVFLDVELSDEMGFELFNHFDRVNFDVVFVTSHEEYAMKAIKYSAFDYILKAVNIDELRVSLNRFKEHKSTHHIKSEAIQLLLENFKTNSYKKLALSTAKGLRIVLVENIIRCEADASYSNIFLANKEKLTVTKNLKDIEEILQTELFIRIHKSHLINANHIKEFLRKDGGTIVMSDNTEICVSVRKRDWVINFLKGNL